MKIDSLTTLFGPVKEGPKPALPTAEIRATLRARWLQGHHVFGSGIGPATRAIADLEHERQKGRVRRGE